VNVSAGVLARRLRASEISSLAMAADLLRNNRADLTGFLTADERGRHLPAFMIELAECLGREQTELLDEVTNVERGLEHIKQIVSAQQRHAKHGNFLERVAPAAVFDEAIAMDLGSNASDQVRI